MKFEIRENFEIKIRRIASEPKDKETETATARPNSLVPCPAVWLSVR